jgi:hypothetical protein
MEYATRLRIVAYLYDRHIEHKTLVYTFTLPCIIGSTNPQPWTPVMSTWTVVLHHGLLHLRDAERPDNHTLLESWEPRWRQEAMICTKRG